MDETSKCDLPYGHFGRGDYLAEDQSWRFERDLTADGVIQLLEDPTLVYQAFSRGREPGRQDGGREVPSRRRPRQVRALLRRHPEIQPASASLSRLLQVSEAVVEEGPRYESTRGKMIAFGEIRSKAGHRSVTLAAFASGDSGHRLRLVQMKTHKRSWVHNKTSWLEMPSLNGEGISWTSESGPIQQIIFTSAKGYDSSYLAVRLLSQVVIFQPTLGKAVGEGHVDSGLVVNKRYVFKPEDVSGSAPSDIAFNPWFSQQLGIADQDGSWRVLEFKSRRMDEIGRVWKGSASTGIETDSLNDGWARITWIRDFETIAVCTRQNLKLFNIANDEPSLLQEVQIDLNGIVPWILDFLVIPEHIAHFCVLTGQHVIMFQIFDSALLNSPCRPNLRIRHFRDPEDLSMRITSWADPNNLNIVLWSAASPPRTCYRVKLPELDQLTAEDHFAFDLVGVYGPFGSSSMLADFHVRPVRIGTQSRSKSFVDRKDDHRLRHTQFYHVVAFDRDNSILEGLIYRAPKDAIRHQQVPLLVSAKGQRKITNKKLRSDNTFVEDDAYILDRHEIQRAEPIARRRRQPHSKASVKRRDIDLGLVSSALQILHSRVKPIENFVSEIKAALAEENPERVLPMQTLRDFAAEEIELDDVNQASAMLEEVALSPVDEGTDQETDIRGQLEQHLRHVLAPITLPEFVGMHDEALETTLSSICNLLVERWIGSLSSQVPTRVRVAKWKLVRSVAIELALASRTIQTEERSIIQVPEEAQASSPAMDRTWELPVRGMTFTNRSRMPSPGPSTDRYLPIVSALPTPSPTATPSITTASSYPSSHAAPELYRLSKFTTFAKPAPSLLPRPLSKVLSHWTIGADTTNYDWLAMSRNISQAHEDADEEMTEKERKRMRQRAERHIRRQRREAAASRAQQLATTQAAEIFSASQPSVAKVDNAPFALPGSSQSQGQNPVSASQVMPGRFGGRPPPKKKRKQGF